MSLIRVIRISPAGFGLGFYIIAQKNCRRGKVCDHMGEVVTRAAA